MPETKAATSVADDVIDAIESGELAGLEAVRRFVDSVDEALPAPDGVPSPDREKIIDSAFKMVEQLLSVSNDFARNITKATEDILKR